MSVITSGSGTQAGVTSAHRQMVHATTSGSKIDQILNGWAFTVIENTCTPTGADDCWLYLGNNSSDTCVVDRIGLTDAGAEVLYFVLADTYTLATTHAAVDSAYNRSGASNALSTKMTAEAGVDITGIGGTTYRVYDFTTGAGTVYQDLLDGNVIVIPPGQSLSVFATTGTAAITNINIDLHFLMEPRTDL